MAVTAKLLNGGVTGTATPTVASYTVPASTTAILTNVTITNNTTSTVSTYFSIGTASNPETIYYKTLAANQTVLVELKQVLVAGEQIWRPWASAESSVYYWFSGVEIT